MIMSGKIFNRILLCAALIAGASLGAHAQANTSFAPYSIFGVGDLATPGTAYNKSMGGVGIANRNNAYINITNPAAITARDSLAFMADFSLYGENKLFEQGDINSVNNTFNINDCVISFPIYRSSAVMLGITPYSGTGYSYNYKYSDPAIIGRTGNINYSATGQGAIYQLFGAAAVTFWKRLSLGAEAIYYFGETEKNYYGTFSDASYNGVKNGFDLQLHSLSGKFGVQYEQPVGDNGRLTLGATYTMGTDLKGTVEEFSFSSGTAVSDTLKYSIDTLANNPGRVSLAGEIGVGVCYRHSDKWMIEFDYTRSDWRGTGLDKMGGFMGNKVSSSSTSVFSTTVSQAFRLGFEIIPNRNDIRYYLKTVTYRGGAYYKNEYYLLDGQQIYSMGITLGATLPVFQGHNGLSLGVDIGQRGTLSANLIRERYINFSVGINIFDIWFRKTQYR